MLNYATIGVVILYLFYNFSFFFYGCLHRFDDEDKYYDKVYSNLEEFTSWTFMVLAFLFVVLGFVLLTKLKRHVPAFYGEHRCLMIWATILLTVPLTFRAVFDFKMKHIGCVILKQHDTRLAGEFVMFSDVSLIQRCDLRVPDREP